MTVRGIDRPWRNGRSGGRRRCAEARKLTARADVHRQCFDVFQERQGGFRAPEDLKKTPLNPVPDPKQLEPNERVERIRRIQLNDLENLPFFLVAGLLYVLTSPGLLLAQWLVYGYAASRFLHFVAYFTAQAHEMRATLWTAGSLILIFMTVRTLLAALGY